MRQCVEHLVPGSISEDQNVAKYRGKILLGLNFYGYDYTAQGASSAILGNHFAEMLQKFKPKISWSDQFAEHYVQIRGSVKQFSINSSGEILVSIKSAFIHLT